MECNLLLHPLLEPMNTHPLTITTSAQNQSVFDHGKAVFQFAIELLKAFFQFLLVIDAPQLQAHRSMIRGLFVVYFLPCFIVFGIQAVIIMLAYQIGFKLLLRAVLYK
jgi:hypothetical protein